MERGDKKTFTVDKFCESSLKSKWNYKISENDLDEKITNHFKLPKELYKLAALEQVKEKNNSRTQEVIVKFTNGESNKIAADSFRALLGYQVLKSTQFEILNTEKQIYFSGKGFGHGVGMCQQGSRAMALQKKSYQEILALFSRNWDRGWLDIGAVILGGYFKSVSTHKSSTQALIKAS